MVMNPANTRRWLRHQVKLPVRIITANDTSEITVPGLTTEISQGGMALYGGVPLQPGDLMEVEFQTSSRLRVAASSAIAMAIVSDWNFSACWGATVRKILRSCRRIQGVARGWKLAPPATRVGCAERTKYWPCF